MSSRPIQCRITVRGRVAPHWSPWLGELQLSYRTDGEDGTVTDLKGTLRRSERASRRAESDLEPEPDRPVGQDLR